MPPAVVIDTPKAAAPAAPVPEARQDDGALDKLLAELPDAQMTRNEEILHEIQQRFGGRGLARALGVVRADPTKPETVWFRTRQIMQMLHDLADPRAADTLLAWIETKNPPPHWRAEAAARMAEVGDVRAARFLGERMRLEPSALYTEEHFWEADEGGHLSHSDLPRVVAARLLSDLAILYPEKRAELAAAAEDAVLAWLLDRPQPHANGLRFLAAIGSTAVLPHLRGWAFPKTPLPAPGAQPPFPADFENAQVALRYLGWIKDAGSFGQLVAQLQRKKDPRLDITMGALAGSNNAMLGMALRALGHGAAQGLSQWGDPRGQQPLMTFIEDETWNEEARDAACEALAWCSDDAGYGEILRKVDEFSAKHGPGKELIALCYDRALAARPSAAHRADLVDLVSAKTKPAARRAAAQALAALELDREAQAKLATALKDRRIRVDAALALLLGGSGSMAGLLGAVKGFEPAEQAALKQALRAAFGALADEDPRERRLARWALRAEAAVAVGGEAEGWLGQTLTEELASVMYDAGPHTQTRVILRVRLFNAARGATSTDERRGLCAALARMNERGALMALGDEAGELGEIARKALAGI